MRRSSRRISSGDAKSKETEFQPTIQQRTVIVQYLGDPIYRHEADYVKHLAASGLAVTVIESVGVNDTAVAETLQAMQAGTEVIVQGAFRKDGWNGRTDILRRVAVPSNLGAWSYEVIDTKLASETKGGTVLQLCLYSDLVAAAQDHIPSENVSERQAKINALVQRLTADCPDDPADRDADQQARWILAHVLDWHRREEKSIWWEYFRLAALDAAVRIRLG
ncbi:hypothetical protein [Mesorhizobium sophorae]|uniref:hypothetical protein n=1 Tax=Mesorhizobium sophorae TaxID=1300294 RepID=UPI001980FE5E|nr:hypothetical protein [Mesorhizobium sophorae]